MIKIAARPWRTGRGVFDFIKPRVMGILNVTPDSFWDGGLHSGVTAALHHAEKLMAEGADIIDVGGESTRPGAEPVSAPDEIARIAPVVRALAREFDQVLLSVDTVKSATAAAAADEGAAIINDVSGLRLDPELGRIVAERALGLVLMHSRGSVAEMAQYRMSDYGADPVGDILDELRGSVRTALEHGVPENAIVLDPGLGFSKRTEHSVAVLRQLERFVAEGFPVLVGPSRKRFVGDLSGGLPPEERLEGTLAVCVAALAKGAHIFRVHDVGAARRALDVAHAILNGT
ncbi:MAG TPA: dihydropteroate synthase [Longimicrobiales bacterium]